MGELHRVPTKLPAKLPYQPQKIIHLGMEHDGVSGNNAEMLLKSNHTVTMVGRGLSMEPIIPDATRMVIGPWEWGRSPKQYEVLFCRVPTRHGTHYTLHLCWWVKRRKFLMIDTAGNVLGYIPFKNILGEYLGAWNESGRTVIPYIPKRGV